MKKIVGYRLKTPEGRYVFWLQGFARTSSFVLSSWEKRTYPTRDEIVQLRSDWLKRGRRGRIVLVFKKEGWKVDSSHGVV